MNRLKASSQSTNFWNNIATIGAVLLSSIIMVYTNDPQQMKDMSLIQVVNVVLYNAANILSHMLKDSSAK